MFSMLVVVLSKLVNNNKLVTSFSDQVQFVKVMPLTIKLPTKVNGIIGTEEAT
jgi:hypothetical protein